MQIKSHMCLSVMQVSGMHCDEFYAIRVQWVSYVR